jgi:hypothetical protein
MDGIFQFRSLNHGQQHLDAIKKTYWLNELWFAIAPVICPKSQKPEGAKHYSMAGETLE